MRLGLEGDSDVLAANLAGSNQHPDDSFMSVFARCVALGRRVGGIGILFLRIGEGFE